MENPEVPIKKKRGRKPKNQLATENAITVDIQEFQLLLPFQKNEDVNLRVVNYF